MLTKWIEKLSASDKDAHMLFDGSSHYIHISEDSFYTKLDLVNGVKEVYTLTDLLVSTVPIPTGTLKTLRETTLKYPNESKMIIKRHHAPPKIVSYVAFNSDAGIGELFRQDIDELCLLTI